MNDLSSPTSQEKEIIETIYGLLETPKEGTIGHTSQGRTGRQASALGWTYEDGHPPSPHRPFLVPANLQYCKISFCKSEALSRKKWLLQSMQATMPSEQVLNFLKQFIQSCDNEELEKFIFLQFNNIMSRQLTVTFNRVTGLARRRVTHTCGNVIEISIHFRT